MAHHSWPFAAAHLLLIPLLYVLAANPAQAALLAEFDFEAADASFELSAQSQHPRLDEIEIFDRNGTLTDFAGNPGRALAISQFTSNNELVISFKSEAGYAVKIETLQFDLRVSASGPQDWYLSDGQRLFSGLTATSFVSETVSLNQAGWTQQAVLTLGGNGASSSLGTLRLDNLRISGEVRAVPLPAALLLFSSAAVVLLRQCKRHG